MICRFDALANKLPPMLPPGGSALVDARDVADGMAEIGRSGERYILSGDFAELSDIIARLAASTCAKPPKRRIRFGFAVAMASAVETQLEILLLDQDKRIILRRPSIEQRSPQGETGVCYSRISHRVNETNQSNPPRATLISESNPDKTQ